MDEAILQRKQEGCFSAVAGQALGEYVLVGGLLVLVSIAGLGLLTQSTQEQFARMNGLFGGSGSVANASPIGNSEESDNGTLPLNNSETAIAANGSIPLSLSDGTVFDYHEVSGSFGNTPKATDSLALLMQQVAEAIASKDPELGQNLLNLSQYGYRVAQSQASFLDKNTSTVQAGLANNQQAVSLVSEIKAVQENATIFQTELESLLTNGNQYNLEAQDWQLVQALGATIASSADTFKQHAQTIYDRAHYAEMNPADLQGFTTEQYMEYFYGDLPPVQDTPFETSAKSDKLSQCEAKAQSPSSPSASTNSKSCA